MAKYALIYASLFTTNVTGALIIVHYSGISNGQVIFQQDFFFSRRVLDRPIQFYALLAVDGDDGNVELTPRIMAINSAHADEYIGLSGTVSKWSVSAIPNESPDFDELVHNVMTKGIGGLWVISEGDLLYVSQTKPLRSDFFNRMKVDLSMHSTPLLINSQVSGSVCIL